jgi:hypothetical protein
VSLKQRSAGALVTRRLPILLQLTSDLSEVLHPSLRALQGRLSPPAHGEAFDGKRGAHRLRDLDCGHKTVRAHRFPGL